MVTNRLKIVWDDVAKNYLKKSIQYIKLDSPHNALKVSNSIDETVELIVNNPERYPPDKYRLNNIDNRYRVVILYNFRISYYISKEEIRIVRMRHAKQDASFY